MRRILRQLYQVYKWLIYFPLLGFFTVFFVGIGIVVAILFGSNAANRTTGVWWARTMSALTPMRVRVIGREHIDPKTSYVVVANHQSYFDIFVLYGWIGIDIKWVMKKELREIPVFGYAGEVGGNIFIDRSNPKAAYESLQIARKRIRNGTSLIFFPEGKRNLKDPQDLGPFKRGAFVTALDLDLPILPISISGTRKIQPPKSLSLYPGTAVMVIHQAIDTTGYTSDRLEELIKLTRSIIEEDLDVSP
jgi:1-acyl-sn-glycerol-3-phosphate acyltransferase